MHRIVRREYSHARPVDSDFANRILSERPIGGGGDVGQPRASVKSRNTLGGRKIQDIVGVPPDIAHVRMSEIWSRESTPGRTVIHGVVNACRRKDVDRIIDA